jgi:hypothetical protein
LPDNSGPGLPDLPWRRAGRHIFLEMIGEGRVSRARLLFRFGVGATELAGERLIEALQALDALLPGVEDTRAPQGALTLHDALLGALSALPGWARAALARGQVALLPGRDRFARGRRLVSRLTGARRARRRYDDAIARARAQLGRWAVAGRHERQAARDLAATAIDVAAHELVTAVAESPELKRVIAEQSESLGRSAMTELRDGAARSDAIAERAAQRLLRRSR